jgi:hypothetical protein
MFLKVFKSIRTNRNETLLEILGAVATSNNPLSRLDIQNRLKVRVPGVIKRTNGEYVYSNIHKNTKFLERKDFLRITQTRARKEKLYDVTVKGALASLFSSYVSESKAPILLETWRVKDWGSWGAGYDQPFANVKDVSELRKIVETLCLHGNSLDDVSEDILKRSLRDPEEVFHIIQEGKITLNKRIDEPGKYFANFPRIPGSVQTTLIGRTSEVAFYVVPDAITSKVLYDLILDDPNLQKTIEMYFLTILQTLTHDFKTKGRGSSTYHYFSDSKTAVLTFTIPEKIASLLHYPEKIAEYTQKSFDDIVRLFLQNPDFVQGKTSHVYFYAFRYDPECRDLLPLSTPEIKEKAYNLLKQLTSREP